MTKELYKRHRPKDFDRIYGHPETCKALEKMIGARALPHTILFSGPSGVGKTTLGRILRRRLEINEELDFEEINAASERGIDKIREIEISMNTVPMGGTNRMYLLDEVHQLSRRKGGDAQTALLKILEDTPEEVYFVLCTTNPNDLLPTIVNRCTHFALKPIPPKTVRQLILDISEKEDINISEDATDRIIEVVRGSARAALVLLEQVSNLETEEEQLNAILASDTKHKATEIYGALVRKTPWAELVKILKAVDEEPEAIRHLILACATNALLAKANPRANLIIKAFQFNFYDSKKAGLVSACWDVLGTG